MNRRQFLQTTAGAAALLSLRSRVYGFSQSPGLQKYVQPLPGLGPTGIPFTVGVPDPLFPGGQLIELVAGQYSQQLHPSLPKATTLWGYAEASTNNFRHLGPIIVAQRNVPVRVKMTNKLPGTHIIPVDTTVPGAEVGQAQNRIAVHLHGGFTPWISDGGPFTWFTPNGVTGPSFLNNVMDPGALPGQANYYYTNAQSARLMWYHDHAMGTTRINAYAGLASGYVLRDYAIEQGAGLPVVELGGHEVPLIIQDKIFVPSNIALTDPTWKWGAPGDLWYPHIYEHNRWKIGGNGGGGSANNLALPDPSCIPEFFGDTMLMNGVVYPTLTVEPRRYRFRILNACQAKFCNLQLFQRDASVDGITLANNGIPTNPAGPAITQIGTEGGFLPAPVVLNNPPRPFNPATMTGNLVLAPAERADVLIDFSAYAAGTKFILYTDAPAPFPMGTTLNDYYPGAPQNPVVTAPGFGPDTRQLLQIVVGPAISPPDLPLNLGVLRPDPSLLAPVGVLTPPPGVPVRDLTLNEDFDANGRLMQRLGTNIPLYPKTFGRNYMDPATETPKAGSIEVWRVFNVTADTHPIHFHLVNVQVLSRQPFQVSSYGPLPNFSGPARGPEPNELGWKETVRMNPGECTTVLMKFDLPTTPFPVPPSPRTGGNEYVWHCHILEHEEHDMMRPLVVV